MNQKILLCAIVLLTVQTNIKSMSIFTPFDTGCEKVASSLDTVSNSFESGSEQLSESLNNTGDSIKEAGEHVLEGLLSVGNQIEIAGESVREAAVIASNITHTWDPESRQLSNAVVKEFAVSTLGLAVSLTGLYILYQSIHKLLLKEDKQPQKHQDKQDKSRSQKIKYFLQKNSRSLTAGLIGLLLSCSGLKIIQNNSYFARTL